MNGHIRHATSRKLFLSSVSGWRKGNQVSGSEASFECVPWIKGGFFQVVFFLGEGGGRGRWGGATTGGTFSNACQRNNNNIIIIQKAESGGSSFVINTESASGNSHHVIQSRKKECGKHPYRNITNMIKYKVYIKP